MSRRLRNVPDGGSLVEVTCRTIQERLLMRPSPLLNDVILGVLGRAQRLYEVEVVAYSFLSNHYLCAALHKKFFDDLCGPIKELAEKYGFDPNFLLALSAYESGWLGDHGRELNNAFGLTRGGGNNLKFGSLAESVEYWGRNFGEKARGAESIDDFIQQLQTDERAEGGKGKYNSVNPDWEKKVKQVYDSVLKRVEECGCDK